MRYLTCFFVGLGFLVSSLSVSAASCQLTDVTATNGVDTVNATQCANGAVSGDLTGTEVNNLFGLSVDWDALIKSDDLGSGLVASEATTGTWSYSGSLGNPFVIVLKASTNFAAYLFDSINNAKQGEFTISFTNNGGQTPDLSHMTIYNTVSAIPVPAALWLFAPALIGFFGLRRKLS